MIPIRIYAYLALALGLIGFGVWHHLGDVKVRNELEHQTQLTQEATTRANGLEQQLKIATQDKEDLDKAKAAADATIAAAQVQLAATLKKLKAKPVPVAPQQCTPIIDYIYESAK